MLVCRSPRLGSDSVAHSSVHSTHLLTPGQLMLNIFWVVPFQRCRSLVLDSSIQHDQIVTGQKRSVTPALDTVLFEQVASR